MKLKKDANSTREQILKAANHLVIREGTSKLTLDAVAQAAGVSKGGLLYHFPSKDDLVAGMLQQLSDDFTADVQSSLAREDHLELPGKWLRGYIHATFHADPTMNEVSAGLLAAIATNPALLGPLQESMASWQAQAENDGVEAVLATIIRLATDGLWISELFGLAPIDKGHREAVIARLIDMTRSNASGKD